MTEHDAKSEASKLQKNVGGKDLFYFTLCTLVGVDTVAIIAAQGAQAFTWLVLLGILFFIPSAMVFAELGTAFPQEGGPYVWVRMAFGKLPAAINNFFYWVTNPVWFGGTLALLAAATVETFFVERSLTSFEFYLFTLFFIWIGILASILSFNVGRWVPILGAYSRLLLLGGFSVSTLVYGFKNGIHGVQIKGFMTSLSGMVTLAGVILFNYVGFENPHSAGEEMKNPQKDIPLAIRKGTLYALALYGIPVLGILLVLPVQQVTALGGFIDAIKAVFSVYGEGNWIGQFMAMLFILCLLSSGTAWIMGSDRALAVSGYDGAAPRWIGKISNRFGTPVRANLTSGVLATVMLIATRILSKGDISKYFGAVLNMAVSTTLLSYLVIFPALWKLRKTHSDQYRPFKTPWAPITSVWLTLCILFASIQLVAPGLGINWFGSDFAPKGWNQSERLQYLWIELIPLVLFIAVGTLFWFSGRRSDQEFRTDSLAE